MTDIADTIKLKSIPNCNTLLGTVGNCEILTTSLLNRVKRARRPIAEVKFNPAGLELGWVTDKKYPLLYAIFFVCLLPFYFSFLFFFLSLLFLRTKPLVDIFIITIFFFNFITKNIGSAGSADSAGSAVCSSTD